MPAAWLDLSGHSDLAKLPILASTHNPLLGREFQCPAPKKLINPRKSREIVRNPGKLLLL
jgi:hypothetical protein